MNIKFLDNKKFFLLAGFLLLLFLVVSMNNVCAEDTNNITVNNTLNSNVSVLPFSHNSNINYIPKKSPPIIIETNNSSSNMSKILENSSVNDLMNKSMYNKKDIKSLINVLNSSDNIFLINNITIKDIMNNLFKEDGVINLTSTINYIDYILDYDIIQMRITLKLVKEYLVNLNESNVNVSTVDNYLKPFMLGLRNKGAKLNMFAVYIGVLGDYFKTNIKPNQLRDINNNSNKVIKHMVDVNNLNYYIKQLTQQIAQIKFLENFLKSIKSDLKLIDKEIHMD